LGNVQYKAYGQRTVREPAGNLVANLIPAVGESPNVGDEGAEEGLKTKPMTERGSKYDD